MVYFLTKIHNSAVQSKGTEFYKPHSHAVCVCVWGEGNPCRFKSTACPIPPQICFRCCRELQSRTSIAKGIDFVTFCWPVTLWKSAACEHGLIRPQKQLVYIYSVCHWIVTFPSITIASIIPSVFFIHNICLCDTTKILQWFTHWRLNWPYPMQS